MKEIPLTRGFVAVIDDCDFDTIGKFNWFVSGPNNNSLYYAVRNNYTGGRRKVFMHRVIVNAIRGQIVDHKNGNGLDNTRGNLRVSTHSQNIFNQRKRSKKTSLYRGVYRFRNRWRAQIKFHGKQFHLGAFLSESDAARVWDKHALRLFGEFAPLNFPISENFTGSTSADVLPPFDTSRMPRIAVNAPASGAFYSPTVESHLLVGKSTQILVNTPNDAGKRHE